MIYYVLFLWGDVEPQLNGPFKTAAQRDKRSHELRRKYGEEHGIYTLDIDHSQNFAEVGSYSGAFFEEDDHA